MLAANDSPSNKKPRKGKANLASSKLSSGFYRLLRKTKILTPFQNSSLPPELRGMAGGEEQRRLANVFAEMGKTLLVESRDPKQALQVLEPCKKRQELHQELRDIQSRCGATETDLKTNKRSEQNSEAESYLRNALELHPEHETAQNWLGVALLWKEESKEAESLFRKLATETQSERTRVMALSNLVHAIAEQEHPRATRAIAEARNHLPVLITTLMGSFNCLVYASAEREIEILRVAGLGLSSFALKNPEEFLKLRVSVRANRNSSFALQLQSNPELAAELRESCPPLFYDEALWGKSESVDGFELFWNEASKTIHHYAKRIRSREDAEEWVQFCSVQLFLDLQNGRYRPQHGAFTTWLRSWASFRWKDWWGRRPRELRPMDFENIEACETSSQETNPEHIVAEEEAAQQLLEKIPWQEAREALAESTFSNDSQKEIARSLGISLLELNNWLRRGKDYLRRRTIS